MKTLGYYNGKIDELDRITVPMLDRGCYFGDGVYDATYSRNYKIFALDEHIDRIYNSAALLRIEIGGKVYDLHFLQVLLFILVIAGLVQMLETVLKKMSPSLYQALGIFLPLITTNCCILGVSILVANGTYNAQGLEPTLLVGVIYAFATAIGFALALIIFAGIREQLSLVKIPKNMQGIAIALITAGLLALAFMGFSGVDQGIAAAVGLK